MATYYWVGGSGTWNDINTANWSLSSGGAGGAGVPTANDDVIVDGNSGALGTTITLGINQTTGNFTYTSGNVGISGSQFLVTKSFTASSAFPVGGYLATDLIMTVSTATGISIRSVSALKNVFIYNTSSPSSKVTLDIAGNLICEQLYIFGTSITSLLYSITCTKLTLDSSGASYAKTIGTSGSSFGITINSNSAVAFTSNWTNSNDYFYGLTITVKDGTGGSAVVTPTSTLYQTTFNLVVDNTVCTNCDIRGGVDNLTLINAGSLQGGNFPVFGSITVNSGCGLSSQYGTDSITLRKKTGSPNVSRVIQSLSGNNWTDMGLINSVAAGTDSITISGQIGLLGTNPYNFQPGTATISAFASIFAQNFVLANGLTINSPVTLTALTLFTINAGATITGTYTLQAYNCGLDTNGVTVPNLNAYGNAGNGCTVTSNLVATNLSILGRTGVGETTFEVVPGYTVTVTGSLIIAGNNATDKVTLAPYRYSGPTAWSFIKASGTVSAVFTTISYNNASGGAKFEAFTSNGNVNGGNNTGWIFNPGTGNFFVFL